MHRSHDKWTKEEEEDLVRQFKSDADIEEIAKSFGRSELAVRARLVKIFKLPSMSVEEIAALKPHDFYQGHLRRDNPTSLKITAEMCNICHSDKRPLRYVSKRLQICQWCVSFLCKKPIDPRLITKDIYKQAQLIAETEVKNEIKRKTPSYAQVRNEVLAENSGKLLDRTFLTRLFKSKDIERQDNRIRQEIEQRLKLAESLAIPPDKEEKVRSLFKMILEEVINRKRIPVFTKTNLHIRHAYYGVELRKTYSHKPVDATTLKYFTAIHCRITTGNSRMKRMSANEWHDLRVQIRMEDGNKCCICRATYKDTMLNVHHIIPLSKFGSNHVNNLITLCEACHQKAHPDLQLY